MFPKCSISLTNLLKTSKLTWDWTSSFLSRVFALSTTELISCLGMMSSYLLNLSTLNKFVTLESWLKSIWGATPSRYFNKFLTSSLLLWLLNNFLPSIKPAFETMRVKLFKFMTRVLSWGGFWVLLTISVIWASWSSGVLADLTLLLLSCDW